MPSDFVGWHFFYNFAADLRKTIKMGIGFLKHLRFYLAAVTLSIVLPLMLGGCQNGNKGRVQKVSHAPHVVDSTRLMGMQNSEVGLMTEQSVVLERVKDIFQMVKSDCMGQGCFITNDMYDKTFCSKSWNELLMDVRRKEHNTNTLFFEVDYWTMTYDPGIFNFDEFEVTQLVMEPKKMASVSFMVYEAYSYTPARVDLVYEDGRWVIDNFYDLRYMIDVRNSMWNYIHNDFI